MEYVDKLDVVLKLLASEPIFRQPLDRNTIIAKVRDHKLGIEDFEVSAILNKLVREKIVDELKVGSGSFEYLAYLVSIDGLDMYAKGGYVKAEKRKAEIQESTHGELVRWNNSAEINQRTLNTLTAWLAVGTIGLFLIEIVKLFIEHNPFCR